MPRSLNREDEVLLRPNEGAQGYGESEEEDESESRNRQRLGLSATVPIFLTKRLCHAVWLPQRWYGQWAPAPERH